MIALGVMTLLTYDQLPERIPMNYNLAGDVTSWEEKTYGTVLILPAIQLFLVIIFLFINIVIAGAKHQVSQGNPKRPISQKITFREGGPTFLSFPRLPINLI